MTYTLSLMVFLPLVFAVATAFSPTQLAKWLALAGSILTGVISFYVWYAFDGASAQLQFVETYQWLPDFGIQYLVGVDGISLLLVVLTGFLTPLVMISLWGADDDSNLPALLSLLLALETGMMGALVAIDLVLFYMFWEAMLIPMYFMIGIWGGTNRIYATTKFVIYTVLGSLLMLAAAIYLYLHHFAVTGAYTTNLLEIYQTAPQVPAPMWLFAAFLVAFAIKVPMWPFHTWLPDAHTEAPTVGSVILAGVLLKMGTYGLLRFAIPLFPDAVATAAPLIVALGITGIVYGALTAWAQGDAKKLVAYSSVSHLGFVVIGSVAIIKQTGHLSEIALTGAVYQMINHGISTGALFFLVGVIYERRHTRQLSDFGGLAKVMPWFAVMLIVATLSSVGLPGTGGFVGEFLILMGTFQASPLAAIIAGTGVLLGAIYMLTLCRAILFGPVDKPENAELKDLSFREVAYLAPLAILAIAMGVFPDAFLGKTRPSIKYLAENFRKYELTVAESHHPVNTAAVQTSDEGGTR